MAVAKEQNMDLVVVQLACMAFSRGMRKSIDKGRDLKVRSHFNLEMKPYYRNKPRKKKIRWKRKKKPVALCVVKP